jgi:hypothetical protein
VRRKRNEKNTTEKQTENRVTACYRREERVELGERVARGVIDVLDHLGACNEVVLQLQRTRRSTSTACTGTSACTRRERKVLFLLLFLLLLLLLLRWQLPLGRDGRVGQEKRVPIDHGEAVVLLHQHADAGTWPAAKVDAAQPRCALRVEAREQRVVLVCAARTDVAADDGAAAHPTACATARTATAATARSAASVADVSRRRPRGRRERRRGVQFGKESQVGPDLAPNLDL